MVNPGGNWMVVCCCGLTISWVVGAPGRCGGIAVTVPWTGAPGLNRVVGCPTRAVVAGFARAEGVLATGSEVTTGLDDTIIWAGVLGCNPTGVPGSWFGTMALIWFWGSDLGSVFVNGTRPEPCTANPETLGSPPLCTTLVMVLGGLCSAMVGFAWLSVTHSHVAVCCWAELTQKQYLY